MIQRLIGEVQTAKKSTAKKEKELEALETEMHANATTLLSARQEKAAAEQTHKDMMREMQMKNEEHERALRDLEMACQQTKKKQLILDRREQSRQQVMTQALGELSVKESKKLKQEQFLHKTQIMEVQKGLSTADEKVQQLEADFQRIAEAAGTTDVDHIVSKYNTRGETFTALQKEYLDAETKMKVLRENHKALTDSLNHVRGTATNTRGVYLEMDETASKLKEIEKEALVMSEKCNRVNVILDSFRSCMQKSLAKMESVNAMMDYGNEKQDSLVADGATPELVHLVEQRLNRVIDTINREKAELEFHRAEAAQGLRRQESAEKLLPVRQPAASETEEHFILRMSMADVSKTNVRVESHKAARVEPVVGTSSAPDEDMHVSSGTATTEPHGGGGHLEHAGTAGTAGGAGTDDDLVIDRHTRKKLANMVVSRGRRGKKTSGS